MTTLNTTKLIPGATATADDVNTALKEIENWANGSVDNGNLSVNAAVANSKLAAPKAWFSKSYTLDVAEDRLVVFAMPPMDATLVHLKVYCDEVPTLGGGEYLGVDLQENLSSVLNAPIEVTASDQMYTGDLADTAIAANATMRVVLDHPGGTVGTFEQVTIDILFKLNHVA